MANWNEIKTEYITTDTSYRKLAEKHGISYQAICRRSQSERWGEQREQHMNKTVTKTLNAISTKQADRAAKLISASDLLLDKVIARIVNDAELHKDTDAMKDISVILKNMRDTMMIKSEADLREQNARIAKLQKEAERDKNEGSTEPVRVIIEDGLSKYSR